MLTMNQLQRIALAAIWLLPATALAEKPDHAGKGPMKAAEKRSQQAADHANSQWQAGAQRGEERAAQLKAASGKADDAVNEAADEAMEHAEQALENTDEAAKRSEQEAAKAAKRQEKQSKKAAKRAEKEAEKAAKQAEKELEDAEDMPANAAAGLSSTGAEARVAKVEQKKKQKGFWARFFGGEESE